MQERIAVIDFETTGLNPDLGDRPTEVAVVFVEAQRIVDRYQTLINPGKQIPPEIESLTGITNEMVRTAPTVGTVVRQIHDRIGHIPLVAHNARFDQEFLDHELHRISRSRNQEFCCSMRVARRIYPKARNHKLGTLIEIAGLKVQGRLHRALADAEMTALLWTEMERKIQRDFGLVDIPFAVMRRLQSMTISDAPGYLRRSAKKTRARAEYKRREGADNSKTAKTKARPVTRNRQGSMNRTPSMSASDPRPQAARSSIRAASAAGPHKKAESGDVSRAPSSTVACITCGAAVPVTAFGSLSWLRCPSCGLNTPPPGRDL